MEEESGVTFEHAARTSSPLRAHEVRASTTPNGAMWLSFASQVPLPPDLVPEKRSLFWLRSGRPTKENENESI